MRCLICQDQTRSIEHHKLNKTYYHCLSCDYIFLDPTQRVSFEREKFQYDQHQNSLENEGYVAMFERFLEPLDLKKNDSILDFGSGPTPVLAQMLEKKGHNVFIYDPYYAQTEISSSMRFDVITSTEVIEHIYDPLNTFQFFVEHLTKGGRIALQTQFHPQDDELFINWWYPRDPTHIGFFQTKTFDYLCKKFDLNIRFNDQKSIVILKKS